MEMNPFIRVKTNSGNAIMININHIVSIAESANEKESLVVCVLNSDEVYEINASFEDLAQIIPAFSVKKLNSDDSIGLTNSFV